MKTISSGLNTALQQEVTSLCTCWRIERKDGAVFGFTSHDQPLTIGNHTYESQSGFMSSAIAGSADLSVDNINLSGILDSITIREEDLRNRKFDFAAIYVFLTDWSAPIEDDLKLRRGTLGEVTITQNGEFTCEVRGLNQTLSHNYIEVFSPECRVDFCSARCGLNIKDYQHRVSVFSVTDRQTFKTSGVIDVTSSTSVGAHRYWRVVMNSVINTDFGAIAEMTFFDQNNDTITGGSATASSNGSTSIFQDILGTGTTASRARDGRAETYWQTQPIKPGDDTTVVGQWWQIDFGSPKDVKTFSMTSAPEFDQTPTSWTLYYSNDNMTWTEAKVCSYAWTQKGQTATWGFGSGSVDPINFPTSPGTVPPPFTGMSVYDGGTVTFRTGPNAGRTLEIASFNATTQQIVLFEPLAYLPVVGDMFDMAQGCDNQFATCKTYNNVANFRGEPKVPGQDALLDYPNASG